MTERDSVARQPRVACGAAIVRDGRLLLLLRKRPPEAGHWGIPGGKVDFAEPVLDAVAREVAEETGLVIHRPQLLTVVDEVLDDGEQWVAPTYLVSCFDGEPRLLEPAKHAAIGWFALDDLPHPITAATRLVGAALLHARSSNLSLGGVTA
jgi:ADP-ribose pyrophosphatase YjhB (NUDIX family)